MNNYNNNHNKITHIIPPRNSGEPNPIISTLPFDIQIKLGEGGEKIDILSMDNFQEEILAREAERIINNPDDYLNG